MASLAVAAQRTLLREARDSGRAVGAFNVYNLEGVLAVRRHAFDHASGDGHWPVAIKYKVLVAVFIYQQVEQCT